MKTRIHQPSAAGNTLLVVMMITGLIVAAMGTYLTLASQEHRIVRRSLCWNAALPMAEAGIEDALTHLNKNTNDWTADGWTTNHTKQRALGDGYYNVNFSGNPGNLITIISTGSVQFGDAWLWRTNDAWVSRSIRVTGLTRSDFKFPGLMAMVINFGGTFHADSYDSSDTNYSTAGLYDPRKASDKCLIETPGSGFDLGGNATVAGYVASGPGGAVTSSGSTSVGDATWTGRNTKGIQPGHATNNCTVSFPSVQAPYTSGIIPPSGTVSNTTYDYVLDGLYYAPILNSNSYGSTMYVKASSVLYVTGDVTLTKIVFAPGARLDMYFGASSISFTPAIVGATAPQFTIFALPSCLNLTLNSQSTLYGLIYAPDTALVAAGGANICGAIVGKSFKCTGTFDFHFDLAFSKPRTDPPVRILSWAEL